AFCRLLERWARGDAQPATPGERQSALRRAAERVETALMGLEEPLERYLLELEADMLEGRSWYAGPSIAELLDWEPVLTRAGVRVPAARVAQAYLELAVLVRALEGLNASARIDLALDRAAPWAGLFDLRDNLLGRALEDLRVLAIVYGPPCPSASPSSARSTSTPSRGPTGSRRRATPSAGPP